MRTVRLVGIEKVYLERSPEGEERTRDVSHTFYAKLTRAKAGAEFNTDSVSSAYLPRLYQARRTSLPKNFNATWTIVDEHGVRLDIVSVQPNPVYPNWIEFRAIARED